MNCTTCYLEKKIYIGHWSKLEGDIYFFTLDEPIELNERLWENPLCIEDEDLNYDDCEVSGWASSQIGIYLPTVTA